MMRVVSNHIPQPGDPGFSWPVVDPVRHVEGVPGIRLQITLHLDSRQRLPNITRSFPYPVNSLA